MSGGCVLLVSKSEVVTMECVGSRVIRVRRSNRSEQGSRMQSGLGWENRVKVQLGFRCQDKVRLSAPIHVLMIYAAGKECGLVLTNIYT